MNQSRAIPEAASKARLRLWLRLLKTSRAIEAEVRERLRAEHGTTLPRFDVMAALYRDRAGLRMSALSDVLRVSNGNVTGIVDRLVSEHLVERQAVEGDRRAMVVRLTAAGIEQFEGLAAEHEQWVDDLLSALSAEEADALTRRLVQVTETKHE
jgi:DNA-binding MarR family transcriptional regulator